MEDTEVVMGEDMEEEDMEEEVMEEEDMGEDMEEDTEGMEVACKKEVEWDTKSFLQICQPHPLTSTPSWDESLPRHVIP